MKYEIFFYGGFTISFLAFLCSVILCIKFQIPYIIGLLTGMTAKREAKSLEKKKKPKAIATNKKLKEPKGFHIVEEITLIHSKDILKDYY